MEDSRTPEKELKGGKYDSLSNSRITGFCLDALRS